MVKRVVQKGRQSPLQSYLRRRISAHLSLSLVPLFPVFHKDQDAVKKKNLESNAKAKYCILLRWEKWS